MKKAKEITLCVALALSSAFFVLFVAWALPHEKPTHVNSHPAWCIFDITPDDQVGLPSAEQWNFVSVPNTFQWAAREDGTCRAEDSYSLMRAAKVLYSRWGGGI